MYPYERSLVNKHKDEGFAMLGVNSDPSSLKTTTEDEHINWRNFRDGGPNGSIARAWNISAWPTIYVLDWDRKIRCKNVRGEALSQSVALLLAEQQGRGHFYTDSSALYSSASLMWSGTPRGKIQIRRNRRVPSHQGWCFVADQDEEAHTMQRHRQVLDRGRQLQVEAKKG